MLSLTNPATIQRLLNLLVWSWALKGAMLTGTEKDIIMWSKDMEGADAMKEKYTRDGPLTSRFPKVRQGYPCDL